MGQEELSLLSALVYLLSILSNASRQTDFVLQEELRIPLNDQTGEQVLLLKSANPARRNLSWCSLYFGLATVVGV